MADLLLELFSEEIPARMQVQAAKDLEKIVVGALSDRGLLFEGVKAFSGPRRLTLAMEGLPVKQPDVSEELKGPKVDAPPAALEGFLRKAGVTKDQLKVEKTPKGDVYLAVIERKGRDTAAVLAEILPECFAKLPWPKSMRFPGSPVRWVRPLHGIVCMFDGEVVPVEFAGVTSGNTTTGHRFLSDGKPIKVRHFDDYVAALEKAHVILEADKRKDIIRHEVTQKAFALGLELIEDEGLLNEVSGLAEWPVVLIGKIQDEFMDVPPEILQTSMRTHQKYFSLSFGARPGGLAPQDDESHDVRHAEVRAQRAPKHGTMAPRFAVVANMVAEDGGKEIVAGNERVLRARLSDAKFFWDQDRKRTLESRVDDLKNIVFHAKLGTQYERVERIEALAGEIAEKIGADVKKAKRAARLCKADLTTGVVGEFPELQGVMGRYYALHDGEDAEVADAVRDHYKPVGPSDMIPTNKVSIAVALADKIDQLVGFFAVGERPTGSGDPYALRRAALGLIRLITENSLPLRLVILFEKATLSQIVTGTSLYKFSEEVLVADNLSHDQIAAGFAAYSDRSAAWSLAKLIAEGLSGGDIGLDRNSADAATLRKFDDGAFGVVQIYKLERNLSRHYYESEAQRLGVAFEEVVRQHYKQVLSAVSQIFQDVLGFLADRLKVALREEGTRHDLIGAVFSLGNEDDLVRLVARVEALQSFLKTDDGANLLTAYKRAANILKAEEKKDKTTFDGAVDVSLLVLPEEKALAAALGDAEKAIAADVQAEKFVEAMGVMARLRKPVDAFFDKITVNDKDAKLRENRLKLLARLRTTLHLVADFSKIEG